jgi:hypothetical protein
MELGSRTRQTSAAGPGRTLGLALCTGCCLHWLRKMDGLTVLSSHLPAPPDDSEDQISRNGATRGYSDHLW